MTIDTNPTPADLAAAFSPWTDGAPVLLPIRRFGPKRPTAADEFMYMHRDHEGYWLKHRETRNYLLVRSSPLGYRATPVDYGCDFYRGFYGPAPAPVEDEGGGEEGEAGPAEDTREDADVSAWETRPAPIAEVEARRARLAREFDRLAQG